MTDTHDVLSHALDREPPLDIDWADFTRAGNRVIRRRRTLTAIAGAAGVTILAVGSTLAVRHVVERPATATPPTPSASTGAVRVIDTNTDMTTTTSVARTTSTVTIPGCDVVYGPTNAAEAAPTPAAPSAPDAAPSGAGSLGAADLTDAPDPLTAALWNQLTDWGITVRAGSGYGALTFADSAKSADAFDSTADGRITSAIGDGELWLTIQPDDSDIPACHEGELDARHTLSDGTVVDVRTGTATMTSSDGTVSAPFSTVHAVAHHPDGTLVVVSATNAVMKADDQPGGLGLRSSQGVPLTADQVLALAADVSFTQTGPAAESAYLQWSTVVPNVVALDVTVAEQVLQARGFSVVQPNPGARTGVVIGQSPSPGQTVAPGAEVTLIVAAS